MRIQRAHAQDLDFISGPWSERVVRIGCIDIETASGGGLSKALG